MLATVQTRPRITSHDRGEAVHTFCVAATAEELEAADDGEVSLRLRRSDWQSEEWPVFASGDGAVVTAADDAVFIARIYDHDDGHAYLQLR